VRNSALICKRCGTPDSYSVDGKVWLRAASAGEKHPKAAIHNNCQVCASAFHTDDLVPIGRYFARVCAVGEVLWSEGGEE
jgi:hypothetical protein